MKAWEWLVAKSSITLGTAAEHLVSVLSNTGTNTNSVESGGELVFDFDNQSLTIDLSVHSLGLTVQSGELLMRLAGSTDMQLQSEEFTMALCPC